jgi:ribose/xylose/arabinose/galactoside ABC-type transport system permease subunit
VAFTVAVIAHLSLARTVFGRRLYAIGTNRQAAEISGVPMTATVVTAYVVAGICAALGGVLYSARLGVGQPNLGAEGTVLLDIVGATVIGGTSLYGGRGKVLGTVFGVLFYVLLANSLNLLNLSFYTVTIVKGCVILGAVVLDTLRRRTSRTTRTDTDDPAPTPAVATAGTTR